MAKFEGTTHISAVLDRSGSMGPLTDDTIGGYNTWLKSVKQAARKSGNRTLLTLHLFDDRHETPYAETSIELVKQLTRSTYFARGSTALRDAMGAEINRLKRVVGKGDRALLLVITDGFENASHEISADSLRKMIEQAEAKKNWTIQYLGANQDAFAVGASMGMQRSARVSTQSDGIGLRSAYAATAQNAASFVHDSALAAPVLSQADYDEADRKARRKTPSKSSTPR